MKWVFDYLKPLSKRITVGTIIKIIGTLSELFIPFLLSYILEHVIVKNEIKIRKWKRNKLFGNRIKDALTKGAK